MAETFSGKHTELFDRARAVLHAIADEILELTASVDQVLRDVQRQWMATELDTVADPECHLAAEVVSRALALAGSRAEDTRSVETDASTAPTSTV